MKIKNALLISDLHLGSDIIAQYRGFKNALDFLVWYQEWHNNQIKYSTQPVFILGDIAIDNNWLSTLLSLKGTLHLVLGNHDILPLVDYQKVVRDGSVNSMIMLPHQKRILTHIPVHPCFFDGNKSEWKVIHGHLHTHTLPDKRYINVSMDQALLSNHLFPLL